MSTTPQTELPTSALVGRRLLGVAIDWALCMVIASAFFAAPAYADVTGIARVFLAGDPLAITLIWIAQHLVLVASLGTTIGHRVVGVRVVRLDGVPLVGLLKSAQRTALLALVIPAVVWGPDGRGLHDRVAGTAVVTTRGASA